MKITILDKKPDEEDEIIIKCGELGDSAVKLINALKNPVAKNTFYKDSKIVLVDASEIFYYESVDNRTFAYTENDCFETKSKLYQLEDDLPPDFFRANKAVILNLEKIQSISPAFGGRFEAVLKNGYKIIISRMYVPVLKKRLGLV